MSTTEAPFTVSHNFCAVRANTVDELVDRLTAFTDHPDVPELIANFRAVAASQPPLQGGGKDWLAGPSEDEQAVANLAAAGITGTVIEERNDKWGNRFVKGEPTGQSCQHGERIVAHKKSKAGKPYKAYVCVNDSPFGNYQDGKCDQVYPN
jgi:hypothetical protein